MCRSPISLLFLPFMFPGVADAAVPAAAPTYGDITFLVGSDLHYGADAGGWSAQQKTNYFETIKNYNVLATFSGHTHGVRLSSWRKFYTCTEGTCGKLSGNFFVVHVTPSNLLVIERKATNSWGASFRKTLPVFSPDLDRGKDGIPDWWEKHWGLNANNPSNAARDLDKDGHSDLAEYISGTDPLDTSDAFRVSPRRPARPLTAKASP